MPENQQATVDKKLDHIDRHLADTTTSAEVREWEVLEAWNDPYFLIEHGKLTIKTKSAELVTFVPNSVQRFFLNKIKEWQKRNKEQGRPTLIWVLKARQMGISTLVEAIIYSHTSQHPNVNSLIIADDIDGSDYLFEMSKLYHEQLSPWLRPELKKSNRKELTFQDTHSNIFVDTAGNTRAGRKYTFQIVHGSEVAFWAKPKELFLGLNQAIPDNPKSLVICETTANGVGGYFYNEWQRAVQGRTDWIPVFIPWYWHDEYILADAEDLVIGAYEEQDVAVDEKHLAVLMEKDGQDRIEGRLAWRRWCIKNKCGGDVDLFRQEYPSTPDEAFITSGNCRFNMTVLKDIRREDIREPEAVGRLNLLQQQISFEPDEQGILKIFTKPKSIYRYIIGSDVAEGIEDEEFEKDSEGDKTDYSTAQVLRHDTLEQVAELRCKYDPLTFAEELRRLGYYYNRAFVGIENNNHGYTVIRKLIEIYLEPFIFHMEMFDQKRRVRRKKYGYSTNTKYKPIAINEMDELIRIRETTIRSADLLHECMNYIREPDGKTNAATGCHDDLVMAYAIALQMRKFAPSISRSKMVDYLPQGERFYSDE
jgi:hypothetical protein